MATPTVALSHFGINVTDVTRMQDFYTRVMGLCVGDLKAMHGRLREAGIKEFRVVTHGNAWSVYFGDPEGNRCEVFVDTPWHTPQPPAEPFDIEAPVEAIMAKTEATCRNRPGFVSRADWRKMQVDRMGVTSDR